MKDIHQLSMFENDEIERFVCKDLTKPLNIYSHATVHGDTAHISAVQGFVPGTFEFPPGGVVAEANQMMLNLSLILEGVGSGFDRIMKMWLYFSQLDQDFPLVNEIVNLYIPENSPARSSIGVTALPRKARVVMDCLVLVGTHPPLHRDAH